MNLNNRRKTLIAFVASCAVLVIVIGCSSPTMKSHRVTNANHLQTGVAYFLPKVMIQLVADEIQAPTNTPQTNTFFSITNTYSKTIQETNGTTTSTSTTGTRTETNAVASGKLGPSSPDRLFAVTVNQLVVPDPDHCYSLKLKPSAFAFDHFNIGVNGNGFLSSVNNSNSDQTAQIITKVAQTVANAVEAAGIMSAFQKGPENLKRQDQPTNAPKHFQVVFDPTSSNDCARANAECNFGTKQLLWVECNSVTTNHGIVANCKREPDEKGGVFYRPNLPYILSVYSGASGELATNVQSIIMAPNRSPIFYLPIRRELFGDVATSVTFSNGSLTSLDYTKSSQVAGFFEVPLDLSKMVLSIPTNVIQAKIDIKTGETSLAKERQALADQELTLRNSTSNLVQGQKAFEDFMRTNKPH